MLDFVKKFFSKNLLLKIFSVVFSFCLWVMVVNQQDPVTTETIHNIPIAIRNENYFEEQNQHVTLESEMRLSVTVSGRRSIVENLTADNFNVYIDYLAVQPEEGRAEVSCTVDDRNVTVKHQSVSYVRLNVEDIVSKEYTIQLRTEGTPAEGYVVVAQDAYAVMEPSVVILSGPQSQIDRIASAEAVLDVQDASDTVSGKGKAITFLDADGNPVLLDELKDISYSAKVMMQLSVPVYFVQEVPIRTVEITEDPNNEYYVDSSSLSQESVQLYGPKNVLAGITEIELAAVSAADKTATFQQSYDLAAVCTKLSQEYGVHIGLVGGSASQTTLTVNMKKKEIRSFSITGQNFTWQNSVKGKTYTLADSSAIVQIQGKPSALDSLTSANIRCMADVGALTENGTYEVSIVYAAPEGLKVYGAPQTLSIVVADEDTAGTAQS